MSADRHGMAPASASAELVVPLHQNGRIPKRNRRADGPVIAQAHEARASAARLRSLAEQDPAIREVALDVARSLDRLIPVGLRCIVSHYDERRHFAMICADAEIAKAEHALEGAKINRLQLFEDGEGWWKSPKLGPLVRANNNRWEDYRAAVLLAAETPVRTRAQLDRKKSLIGRGWLEASGEWYDRLRSGVAAEEVWLAEHVPKGRKRPLMPF